MGGSDCGHKFAYITGNVVVTSDLAIIKIFATAWTVQVFRKISARIGFPVDWEWRLSKFMKKAAFKRGILQVVHGERTQFQQFWDFTTHERDKRTDGNLASLDANLGMFFSVL